MDIKINKKTGEGEMHFSWKEIWILIKNKKFIISNQFFDQFLSALIQIKSDMMENSEKDNIEHNKDKF